MKARPAASILLVVNKTRIRASVANNEAETLLGSHPIEAWASKIGFVIYLWYRLASSLST